MLVAQRSDDMRSRKSIRPCRVAGLISIAAAMAVAGCSANITRLDAPPSFALGEGAKTANPNPSRTAAGGYAGDSVPPAPANTYASTPRSSGNVEMAGLPPLSEPAAPPARALAVTRHPAPGAPQAREVAAAPANVAKGQQIEVQQGDTLYAIGKRHKVMISELMAVNELKNPNLKPGQKLYLPASSRGASVVKPQRPAPTLAPQGIAAGADLAQPAQTAQPAPAPVAEAASSEATYTVKPGDSLYAIAAKHKVKLLDLQRANDISDVRKVKPGMVLKMPNASGSTASGAIASASPDSAPAAGNEPRIVRSGPAPAAPAAGSASGLKVLNGDAPRQVAAVEPATRSDAGSAIAPSAAPSSPAAAAGKLRWPAKGRVVQGFGPRPDGTHNDGVDIAVPVGTDVLAAEGGVVAYAGNEVKTYGNLVLVRHDNGWVTAYAYNEKILVNRGDRVKRGQPLAKAGKSGAADQPQVHFEVRVGSKPVDPAGYLDKL